MSPKPQPATPAFLDELLERARHYGWSGDYVEVCNFVEALYAEAGMPLHAADLEPYDDDE